MTDINLPLIMGAALVAMASPGPATLAIASTSMANGRRHGLALASGVTSGSLFWSLAAALGMGGVMATNAWLFEILRYCGAAYLLYLALKSARSALRRGKDAPAASAQQRLTLRKTYFKGLAIHLSNPKAILFIGSIYALGLPRDASIADLATVVLALGLQSAAICHLYAVLFASKPIVAGYRKMRRTLDGLFAMLFGFASIKILTASINQ
ncbi:LysE family translocator [Cohaesibacter haloalkalitolerans]|uniref:LysE family translocator n=1 Tax=Cohaesibacter haloalkalitolerans TaxID=1162980 RepID=UPI000E65A676|nr:LysE family translocator [Cohaesibacter haloalkalitolerans]